MKMLVFIACGVVFLGTAGCEVTVEKGAYSNVLVSFKHGISSELLQDLKVQLQDTSEMLQDAIGLRISKVTVNVPKNWDISEWDVTVQKLDKIPPADILVGNPNDTIFGILPYASQYGPCGVPGHQLIIPTDFLVGEIGYPKGAALAREWIKYRYGVFDENGYPEDDLYPLYYALPGSDPSDVIVTGCSNRQIQYDFDGAEESSNCTEQDLLRKECVARPLEESLENVTSSLMYFHKEIPNMKHVCGKDHHPHAFRSRNKLNSMCQGRSVWDVIQRSKDFKNASLSSSDVEALEADEPIDFTFIQEAAPKVVIAWENTKKLKDQERILTNTIQRFVYEIAKGSKVALFPYTADKITKDYSLRELKNWESDWKFDQISSAFLKPQDGCVTCAIEKALEILASDNSDGAQTIILIVSSNLTIDDDLLQRLKDSKACLNFIIISEDETQQEVKDRVRELNCGYIEEIRKTSEDEILFETIFKAMESTLSPTLDDKVTETVRTVLLKSDAQLTVPVDATVERVTFWIFEKTEEAGNVEIKMDNEEVRDEDIKEDLISDITALSYYPTQAGTVTFKLRHQMEGLVQVRSTSKVGEYVNADIFMQDLTELGSLQQGPVILHASVHFGAYPVQNAEVIAVVLRPNSDENTKLEMFDDGLGDPDITALDGIYSRYFTSFTEKGDYTVTITVKNEGSVAVGGKIEQGGLSTCCGQRAKSGTLEIPNFTKQFQTTFSAVSGRPELGFKPSRIVNLKIENVTDDKVFLTWTAPGAETDNGTVESYIIKYFASEDEINEFENGKNFNFEMTPKKRGAIEVCEARLADFKLNSIIYIAVRSINLNLTSDTSNIVEVLMSDKQITTTEEIKEPKLGRTNKQTIGIIVAIILAVIVIVIILYLVVYFAVVKPKRRKEEKNFTRSNQTSLQTNDNHVLNPVSFVSADTLIKHHNEKTKAKLENKDPPILKEEDFEQRVESRVNNNTERPEYSGANKNANLDLLPPKSPKRTTPV